MVLAISLLQACANTPVASANPLTIFSGAAARHGFLAGKGLACEDEGRGCFEDLSFSVN